MACCVRRSDLTPEQLAQINVMLSLTPVSTGNRYNRGKVSQPIIFYRVDQEYIHLPYLFAASLLQIRPNIDYPFVSSYYSFTGKLRENQVSVAIEAWDQLQERGTSTLGLDPGFGKTILGAYLGTQAQLLTLVLVHREILTTQWRKTFQDVTNARIWIVGDKEIPPVCDVIICMDTRWHLLSPELRDKVGFLIIDEAHCFCTPGRVDCLLAFHPKYTLIETASLEREDEMHTMMYAMVGSHGVYRESKNPFRVMKIMTNTKPIRKLNMFGDPDYTALVRNTLFDERRNQIILNLTAANTHFKILILTSMVDHAFLLNEALNKMGIASDCLCGKIKKYQDATVLVGTVSKIGTGFDQANFCQTYDGRPFDLLILACSLKKYSMLIQNIGRVFRSKNPTVMHLVDNDDTFKRHWYKARKWYLIRGGTITEHSIPNAEQPTPEDITSMQQKWIASKVKELQDRPRTTPRPLTLSVIKK